MGANGKELDGGVRVWIGPESTTLLEEAVLAGGGSVNEYEDANVFVWHGPCPQGRSQAEALAAEVHDEVKVVQLDSAGVEALLEAGVIDDSRRWLSAAGGVLGFGRRARDGTAPCRDQAPSRNHQGGRLL